MKRKVMMPKTMPIMLAGESVYEVGDMPVETSCVPEGINLVNDDENVGVQVFDDNAVEINNERTGVGGSKDKDLARDVEMPVLRNVAELAEDLGFVVLRDIVVIVLFLPSPARIFDPSRHGVELSLMCILPYP